MEKTSDSKNPVNITITADSNVSLRLMTREMKEHIIVLKPSDIFFIEALADYVEMNMIDGKKYTVHATMKRTEETLAKIKFPRCHRRYIVNGSKITKIVKYRSWVLSLEATSTGEKRTKEVPVSASGKKVIMQYLGIEPVV